MKITALHFFVLSSHVLFSQVSDDFSDGEFTSSPSWLGSAANFAVNTDLQLQLNDVAAGSAYLSTDAAGISLDSAEWIFRIKQSFSPSGSNFSRVYLASDQSNLSGPLNGYFLQFGESGSLDAVELYVQQGTTEALVCRGVDAGIASSFDKEIRVTRDEVGHWSLFSKDAGASAFALEASGTDLTFTSAAFFGWTCEYTSSNAAKFYLDDVVLRTIVPDTVPPVLDSIEVLSPNSLRLWWSETLDATSATTSTHYQLSGMGQPASCVLFSPAQVDLSFSNSMSNGGYTFTVGAVSDTSSNAHATAAYAFTFFMPDTASWGDVRVNEVMADPSPSQGLPEVEYIEIWNRSTGVFDLGGWTLSDASSNTVLPSFLLYPGEMMVLGPIGITDSLPGLMGFEVMGFPSLNNSSDQVVLRNAQNELIDSISYDLTWYGDPQKEDGGFSLEMVNPLHPCNGRLNWRASVDHGTPGEMNAVMDTTMDTKAPQLVDVLPGWTLVFDEALDTSIWSHTLQTVTPQHLYSLGLQNGNELVLDVVSTMTPGVHQLFINELRDCWGNSWDGAVDLVVPAMPEPGDLVINELLFNPTGNGKDFVEVYHNGNAVVDLADVFLANWDDDSIANWKPLSSETKWLFPGSYAVITPDTADVKQRYPSFGAGPFVQSALPVYSNDSGSVFLLDEQGSMLDAFSYRQEMHFSLIDDVEGKALERISITSPTRDEHNWHTASQDVGWATPGASNSQAFRPGYSSELETEPEVITPNGDGNDDLLHISVSFENGGRVLRANVHDAMGRPIRQLSPGQWVASASMLTWDGTKEDGTIARPGNYVLVVDWNDDQGHAGVLKEVVVVGRDL